MGTGTGTGTGTATQTRNSSAAEPIARTYLRATKSEDEGRSPVREPSNDLIHCACGGPTSAHRRGPGLTPVREVGMSNELRVDPRLLGDILVDQGGLSLAVHEFAVNRGDSLTLLPTIDQFRECRSATKVAYSPTRECSRR